MRNLIRTKIAFAAMTALAFFAAASANVALAAKLNCSDAIAVMKFALQAHLTTHELSPQLVGRTLERFASLVESQHTILTLEDFEQLKTKFAGADAAEIARKLSEGDCSFLKDVGGLVKAAQRRLTESFPSRERLARELLSASARLTTDTPAPSIVAGNDFVAKDPAELRQTLVDALAVSVQRLKSVANEDDAASFVSQQFLSRLHDQRKALTQFGTEAMLKAFSLALDPHTSYMTRAETTQFQAMMSAGMEGIGIALEMTPFGAKITSIMPESPAAKSGKLSVGDLIVAVNNRSVEHDVLASELAKRLRGKRGSVAQLTLGDVVDKKIVSVRKVYVNREFISSSTTAITSGFLEINQRLILSIRLDIFYGGSGPDLRKIFTARQKEAVEKYGRPIDVVVLDLRGNGGGSLPDSLQIAGLFSDASALFGARNSQNQVQTGNDGPLTAAYHGPLVVAIDEGSASASEIVSGTFKDLNRALIVGGERTFGKGTVQVTEPIEDNDGEKLGALKITIAQFYTAGGNSTQNIGVSSHVVVPGPNPPSPENRESALKYAIESSKIQPLVPETEMAQTTRVDELAPKLQEASKSRVGGRPALSHAEQLHEIHQVAAHYCDLLLSGEREK